RKRASRVKWRKGSLESRGIRSRQNRLVAVRLGKGLGVTHLWLRSAGAVVPARQRKWTRLGVSRSGTPDHGMSGATPFFSEPLNRKSGPPRSILQPWD